MKNYIDNNDLLIHDLEEALFKHSKLIIGLDFDKTCRDSENYGIDTFAIIELMQKCTNLGFDICLWTIITDDGLNIEQKVAWCKLHGINITHVNSSPMDDDIRFSGNRKPYFNVLLDDKAGLDSAYWALKHVIRHLV